MGIGTAQERFKRYEAASITMKNWKDKLQECYDLTLPDRVNFDNISVGQRRSTKKFDATATHAIRMFANNIKSILMPTDRNWAVFVPGTLEEILSNTQKQDLQKELEEQNRILFTYLRRSNFDLEVDSALQDMAISTGILLINEGDKKNPFQFTSVSIDKVAFEKNEKTGKIGNVWRKWKIAADQIYELWPKAKSNSHIDRLLSTNPQEKVEVIEGTIFDPEDEKFHYYVQLADKQTDLFIEKRDYNPWIAFRWNVRTDEVVGFGPALEAMPFISVLNRICDLELQAAGMKVYPPYFAVDSMSWNVNLARLIPGSIIPISDQFLDKDPIRPIPQSGDLNFTQLKIEELRTIINNMLFANPLPKLAVPVRTATEIEINQQNWIRSSGTAIGRITVELLFPLIKSCVSILKKHGLISDIKLDGKTTDLNYDSELIFLQGQEENARIIDYVNIFQQILGPQASLAALNLIELPLIIADNLGVDKRIVADQNQIQQILDKAQQLSQVESQPQIIQNPQEQQSGETQ